MLVEFNLFIFYFYFLELTWAQGAQGELLWSPCVRRPASVVCRQQFIQSTSPPKLLDQFQNNFTQMFPWSSFTKIAKMVPLRWIKWPSELKIEKPLNDISSQANWPISK